EKLARLTSLNANFMAAKLTQRVEEALQANRTFRFALYDYATMPTLTSLIEQLWVKIGPCFNYLYPQHPDMTHGQHNYEALLIALEQGDSQRSEKSIHNAIDDGAAILLENYFNRELVSH
ncbi:FCD domain-containing protein, partial [Pectobacterium polonicum]